MGRGEEDEDMRPVLSGSLIAAEIQVHFMRWTYASAYSLRPRSEGTAYPMQVHQLDQTWVSYDGYRFTHTVEPGWLTTPGIKKDPPTPACVCGAGSTCPVHLALKMIHERGFRFPKDATLPAYGFYQLAPGVIMGAAQVTEERPLFIVRLDRELVLVQGGALSKALIQGERCLTCETQACAHTEAARHADVAVAELSGLGPQQGAMELALMAGAAVRAYPPKFGHIILAAVDMSVSTAYMEALRAQEAAAAKEQDAVVRKWLTDVVKWEKEQKGEVFDPESANPEVATDEHLALAESWKPKPIPETGKHLVISGTFKDMYDHELTDDATCACAGDCLHKRLLALIHAAADSGTLLQATLSLEAAAPEKVEAAKNKLFS